MSDRGDTDFLQVFAGQITQRLGVNVMFGKRVGDLEKEEDFLKSRSPLFFVDKIKEFLGIEEELPDAAGA